jgi:ferredoxin
VVTDIFSAISPQLTIMDGIIAMEGEGPAAGSLRRLGVILTSQDAVAMDVVATKIIGLNPMDIYTTRYSDERGLGIGDLQNIEVIGDRIDDVTIPDFKPPSSVTNALARRMPPVLPGFILRQLSVRPNVIERRCTGCVECAKICPTGAVSVTSKIAKIDRDICIECMCCHEVCRFDAIVPKKSTSGRIVHFLVTALRKLRTTAG